MEDKDQAICVTDERAPGVQLFAEARAGAAGVVLGLGCMMPHPLPPGLSAAAQASYNTVRPVDQSQVGVGYANVVGLPIQRLPFDVDGDPVHQHLRTLVDSLSVPRTWIDEGVELPTTDCTSYSKRVLTRLFSTYGIIPFKITMSKVGGVFVAHKAPLSDNILRIEVDNDLDVTAVVSDGKSILESGFLDGDDLEQAVIKSFNSRLA